MPQTSSTSPPPRCVLAGVARWVTVLTLGGGAAGCIWGSDEPYLASEALPPLQLVGADPVDDASGIPRNAPLTLRFTHRVRPDTVTAQRVHLLRGDAEVSSATRIDLLDCTLSVVPDGPLAEDTAHTLEVDGIEGFGTAALDEPVRQSYRTGRRLVAPPSGVPPAFEEVYREVLAPRCASCHRVYRPPAGLDLSSVEAARSALRDGLSRQDEGAPFVVPGRHADSYLMHKLLGLPGTRGEVMPPPATGALDRACQTPDPALRLVARWIDGLWPPR